MDSHTYEKQTTSIWKAKAKAIAKLCLSVYHEKFQLNFWIFFTCKRWRHQIGSKLQCWDKSILWTYTQSYDAYMKFELIQENIKGT